MKGVVVVLELLGVASPAFAQGWSLDRVSPAPAGDRSLIAQDLWYRGSVPVAAALTLDDATLPLVLERESEPDVAIVEHMLMGHVQTSLVLFDRIGIALSLPVALYQGGASEAVGGLRAGDANLGDLGIGARGAIYGDASTDPFSLHAHLEGRE